MAKTTMHAALNAAQFHKCKYHDVWYFEECRICTHQREVAAKATAIVKAKLAERE